MFRLQEANTKLEAAETSLAERDAEIEQLHRQLAAKEAEISEAQRAAQEREATVQELAHMLAAREASQVALVDTVNAFIVQQASLPATPRAADSGNASDTEANGKRFESMVTFWQERLQAQALESSLKLRQAASYSSCSSSGMSGTLATAKSHLAGEESADEGEEEVASTSSGSMGGNTVNTMPQVETKANGTISSEQPITPTTILNIN